MRVFELLKNRSAVKLILEAGEAGGMVQVCRRAGTEHIWSDVADCKNHEVNVGAYEYRMKPKETVRYCAVYVDKFNDVETYAECDTFGEAIRDVRSYLGVLTVTRTEGGVPTAATFTPRAELPL